jgi:hypothetical protein
MRLCAAARFGAANFPMPGSTASGLTEGFACAHVKEAKRDPKTEWISASAWKA